MNEYDFPELNTFHRQKSKQPPLLTTTMEAVTYSTITETTERAQTALVGLLRSCLVPDGFSEVLTTDGHSLTDVIS